jgi:hypothetical protein
MAIQDKGGQWWVLDLTNQPVMAEWFGVVSGLDPTFAASNTTAIQTALAACAAGGVAKLYALAQYYVFGGNGIRIPNSMRIVGSGVGAWDPIFPSRPKEWTGTNFLAYGTGNKIESVVGVTDRSVSGGWRSDGTNTFKLINFMNTDGSGVATATPRAFSAFIAPLTRATSTGHAYHWGLEDIRIVPWLGTDGISDWSNAAATALGANWDVGVYAPDSEYENLADVQVVGDWRIAALARVQAGYTAYGAGERGNYERCRFQGYRGVLLRASDVFAVIAAAATTINVALTTSNYLGTTGTLQAVGGTAYSWTGTTNLGGGVLQLTGVTPNAAGLTAGTMLRGPLNGSGVSGTQFLDCMIHSLCHVSGQAATALGWSSPSIALEIDGYPQREDVFINVKTQSNGVDPGNVFLGNCADTQFVGSSQFENGSIIATPAISASSATYPAGDTRGLILDGVKRSTINTTGWTPRTVYDRDAIFPASQGTDATVEIISGPAGRDLQIIKPSGQKFSVFDAEGNELFQITPAVGAGNIIIKNAKSLTLEGGGNLYLSNATYLLRSTVAQANGAGSSAGTLTNAPAVGNPTKWFVIDDNGTTRRIPAW